MLKLRDVAIVRSSNGLAASNGATKKELLFYGNNLVAAI